MRGGSSDLNQKETATGNASSKMVEGWYGEIHGKQVSWIRSGPPFPIHHARGQGMRSVVLVHTAGSRPSA